MTAKADETASLNRRVPLRHEAIERLVLKLEPVELVQLSLLTRKELQEAIWKVLEDDEAR